MSVKKDLYQQQYKNRTELKSESHFISFITNEASLHFASAALKLPVLREDLSLYCT